MYAEFKTQGKKNAQYAAFDVMLNTNMILNFYIKLNLAREIPCNDVLPLPFQIM